MLEAELYDKAGRPLDRNRAISRLLEAVELGWVSMKVGRDRLRHLIKSAREEGDVALPEFAERVLGDFF